MLELLNYYKNDEIIGIIFWKYNKKLYIKSNRNPASFEFYLTKSIIKKYHIYRPSTVYEINEIINYV